MTFLDARNTKACEPLYLLIWDAGWFPDCVILPSVLFPYAGHFAICDEVHFSVDDVSCYDDSESLSRPQSLSQLTLF